MSFSSMITNLAGGILGAKQAEIQTNIQDTLKTNTKIAKEQAKQTLDGLDGGKGPNKTDTPRYRANLAKFNQSIGANPLATPTSVLSGLDLAGTAGMASGLGMPGTGMANGLLAPTGNMPADVANAAASLGSDALTAQQVLGDVSMQQMGQVMQMQMKMSTDMSLAKLMTTLNEAMTKEIKKSGEGVKNLAG